MRARGCFAAIAAKNRPNVKREPQASAQAIGFVEEFGFGSGLNFAIDHVWHGLCFRSGVGAVLKKRSLGHIRRPENLRIGIG
jgi:hypothetical protein